MSSLQDLACIIMVLVLSHYVTKSVGIVNVSIFLFICFWTALINMIKRYAKDIYDVHER